MTTTNGHCTERVGPRIHAPPVTPEDDADAVVALEDAHGLIRQFLGQLSDGQQWQWVQCFAALMVIRLSRSYQRRGITPLP